ncbi:Lipoprotein NlpD [Candidatus Enterovibrio altilux]|uniref:Lipoprotein NlpD n=2 Tax=Candidatus Enterovibrio altilux TaxID=1927128 RepID=A0A291BAG2_9GAMM|nr:Lipoprotein NlpD [Candidatus Enterovibrio luxaltus]
MLLLLLVLLTACTVSTPAPVISVGFDYGKITRGNYHGSYYNVQKGDTLYYIAYITGRHVKEIVVANNLKKPYIIFPGQHLNLWTKKYVSSMSSKKHQITVMPIVPVVPPSLPTTALSFTAAKNNQKITLQNKSDSASYKKKLVEPPKTKEYSQSVIKNKRSVDKVINKLTMSNKAISWQWPSRGRVISSFSSSEVGNKGIDIASKRGQSIEASADGKVVYAGSALRGYGNLIIVKHSDEYLSAYAHNDNIFVEEHDNVKKGQKIASMGSSGTNSVRLHFEIHHKGKSVNPLRYLPKR